MQIPSADRLEVISADLGIGVHDSFGGIRGASTCLERNYKCRSLLWEDGIDVMAMQSWRIFCLGLWIIEL